MIEMVLFMCSHVDFQLVWLKPGGGPASTPTCAQMFSFTDLH